jgi:hypothetical protein
VIGGLVAVGLLVSALGAGSLWLVLRGLHRSAPVVQADRWEAVEVPSRLRALLPGPAQRREQPSAGMKTITYQYQPTPDTVYAVSYSEATVPPHRAQVGSEFILKEACDGANAALRQQAAKSNEDVEELGRRSVQLGLFPGKELTQRVGTRGGRMITRMYLAHGRLYLVLAGGIGLNADHENVKRLFDSFQILERPSASPGPAPTANPPVVADRRRPGAPAQPAVRSRRIVTPQQPAPAPGAAKLELPPLPDPVERRTAPLNGETPYRLPEPVGSLRVGGGGRFLILHFRKARKFGVFDANVAKIVRWIPAAQDDVSYAAEMTTLVVFLPGAKVIQRYSLLTGEREAVGKLEVADGKIEAFCMGHASAGPLLVGVAGQGARLFEIDRFKEIALPPGEGDLSSGGPATPRLLDGGTYWAGATGRVLGYTGNYGMPNGVHTVVFAGGGIQRYGQHVSSWFVVPGPDDKHVYSGGHGVLSERLQPVSNFAYSMISGSGHASHLYLPAHHGPYYLHAAAMGEAGTAPGTVRVFLPGDKKPIRHLPENGRLQV